MTEFPASDPPQPSSLQVARLTPPVPSAIATICVQGPGAAEVVLANVKLSTTNLQLKRIYYGLWVMQVGGVHAPASEQVVVCQTAPDVVEIHCHGGNAVCQAIVRSLTAAGCTLATQLRPSRGASPMCEAAERALLSARTDKAAGILLDQVNGALDRRLQEIGAALGDGAFQQALEWLDETLRWSNFGCKLSSAWRIVLAGPPNVGKSSLTNAILGSARSIVHEQPGTTRDWIEVATAIDGWPVTITDTAGVRDSTDAIERQGIAFAEQQIAVADAVILMVDAQTGWTSTHTQLVELAGRCPYLVAWNKCDLPEASEPHLPKSVASAAVVRISCQGPPGIDALLARVSELLIRDVPPAGTALPFDARSAAMLGDLRALIAAGDVTAALALLRPYLS